VNPSVKTTSQMKLRSTPAFKARSGKKRLVLSHSTRLYSTLKTMKIAARKPKAQGLVSDNVIQEQPRRESLMSKRRESLAEYMNRTVNGVEKGMNKVYISFEQSFVALDHYRLSSYLFLSLFHRWTGSTFLHLASLQLVLCSRLGSIRQRRYTAFLSAVRRSRTITSWSSLPRMTPW